MDEMAETDAAVVCSVIEGVKFFAVPSQLRGTQLLVAERVTHDLRGASSYVSTELSVNRHIARACLPTEQGEDLRVRHLHNDFYCAHHYVLPAMAYGVEILVVETPQELSATYRESVTAHE